jgi:cytochrome c-type biogenesis protein CcmF
MFTVEWLQMSAAEWGLFSLILAACLSSFHIVLFSWVLCRDRSLAEWRALSASMTWACFVWITSASFVLLLCFFYNDFTTAYVAAHSNTQLPWYDRLPAYWSGHEGSILLMLQCLSIWMLTVNRVCVALSALSSIQVMMVLHMILSGLLWFLLMTSHPFLRLLPAYPLQGQDLNPLLQDPGLRIHPPMLYIGYIGFALPFAFAMMALCQGKMQALWVEYTQFFTRIAWGCLTLGMVLGSHWAYRELGWGGWWFWDPVENASLMPWLTGLALLHVLSMMKSGSNISKNALISLSPRPFILLAILTFSLSLLGTFLLRSGLLVSVHAFASDPSRGHFLFMLLALCLILALGTYALREKHLPMTMPSDMTGRFRWIQINVMFLTFAMSIVLLATLYPMLMQWFSGIELSIGAPYFQQVLAPLAIMLMLAMGIGVWSSEEKSYRIQSRSFAHMLMAAVCLLLCMVLLPYKGFSWMGVLGLWATFFLAISTIDVVFVSACVPSKAMFFAHIGVCVAAFGMILATGFHQEAMLRLRPEADQVKVAGYQMRLGQLLPVLGPTYTGEVFTIYWKDRFGHSGKLSPELRRYKVSGQVLAKAAIDVGWFEDFYLALSRPLSKGDWLCRVYIRPGVRWIWLGFLWMGLAVLFSALLRRLGCDDVKRGDES